MDHYPELLELNVIIPEEDGEFHSHLHEDDGVSDAYTPQGHFSRTTFSLTRKRDRIRIVTKVAGGGFPSFAGDIFGSYFAGAREKNRVGGVETRARGGRVELDNPASLSIFRSRSSAREWPNRQTRLPVRLEGERPA